MPVYVTLLKLDCADAGQPARPELGRFLRKTAKECRVKVKSLNWTLGHYDGVAVLEAPDDDAVAAALEPLQGSGLRFETLRAFPADHIERILAHLTGEGSGAKGAPGQPPSAPGPRFKPLPHKGLRKRSH
jgi:uncharacterized protein with GYD domain